MLAILEDFNSEPFDEYFSTFISLQTGIESRTDILQALKRALDDGKEKGDLIEERILIKEMGVECHGQKNKGIVFNGQCRFTMNKATKRPLFGYFKLDILDSEPDEKLELFTWD